MPKFPGNLYCFTSWKLPRIATISHQTNFPWPTSFHSFHQQTNNKTNETISTDIQKNIAHHLRIFSPSKNEIPWLVGWKIETSAFFIIPTTLRIIPGLVSGCRMVPPMYFRHKVRPFGRSPTSRSRGDESDHHGHINHLLSGMILQVRQTLGVLPSEGLVGIPVPSIPKLGN